MSKICAISGVNGQTGSFLSELLLDRGYTVHGMIRKSSNFNTQKIDHLLNNPNLKLRYGDLTDSLSIIDFVNSTQADMFFNLGGLSHVRTSYDIPLHCADVDALGPLRVLEAIRKYSPHTKFLQASTSELFGNETNKPQNELTHHDPVSPYSISKEFAYTLTTLYRNAYNLFCCNAISFNHESYRRSPTFVTRKITKILAEIKVGISNSITLGNLSSFRDFSHAKDIAKGMILMLESDTPDDYVMSSNESHSVEEFLQLAASKLDLDYKKYLQFDSRLLRPMEVNYLHGDSTKIRTKLGWNPEVSFEQLVDEMVEYDLKLATEKLKSTNNN